MTYPFVLSFKATLSLHEEPEGSLFLRSPGARIPLDRCSKGMLAVLDVLGAEGATEEQLTGLVKQQDGPTGLIRLFYYLQRFRAWGLICHSVPCNGGTLVTSVPFSPDPRCSPFEPVAETRFVLSRFAYLHNEGRHLVLESPLARVKIVLGNPRAAALLQALTRPQSLDTLCRAFPDLPRDAVGMFMSLLRHGAMLSETEADGHANDENQTLAQWTFHDLLFHARSRMGRHLNPDGSTFRFVDRIDPPPPVKPPVSDDVVPLYKPDLDALQENDVSFTRVLEERRSLRVHGEQPITAEQVGEFLYRTARIRALTRKESLSYEESNRPYPNGGACYELEVYPVVNVCAGLPAGLYHYHPLRHQLHKLTDRTREVELLLQQACAATPEESMPQILLILAARFQRVAWKYDSMAYATTLKNVGVLYQTMYLVATAMDLAACALGNGDADLFARAAGTDYYAETSVGEFILGSRIEPMQ